MANIEWLKKGADGLTFGERLEDLIKLNKTTATALAKDTGLSQSAISDYTNAKKWRVPDSSTIYALARYFSVSADYLLGLTHIKTPDITTRKIAEYTGLSEKNISYLAEQDNSTIGLTYQDFANMCLDVAYIVRGDFYLLALAFKEKMEYEEEKKNTPSLSIKEIYKAWDQALATAKTQGCVLLGYDKTIEFYARNIANDLERYLLGVFNHGND